MANVARRRILLLGTENSDGTVTGVTTGTSRSFSAEDGFTSFVFYFRSVGTTSGGTVLVEEADWGPLEAPYSGTWSQVNSQAASGFTGTAQLGVHLSITTGSYFRVRISSTITGGGTVLISALMS